MSENRERSYMSPEDRFRAEFHGRIDFWKSIVRESTLPDDVKDQFYAVLDQRKEFKVTNRQYESVDDFDYYTRSLLVGLVFNKLKHRTDIDQKELEAVFENIRDDVYAFIKEIKE
ncbi:MAG: hypothetical protein Q7R79_00490 [bacterium]|nr:hypothetical protein [bacterium]